MFVWWPPKDFNTEAPAPLHPSMEMFRLRTPGVADEGSILHEELRLLSCLMMRFLSRIAGILPLFPIYILASRK
jgi:hypothetical protein